MRKPHLTATFYAGVEAVAAASSETRNPGVAMPRAIKQVMFRIAYVYLAFALFIGLVCPADAPGLIGGAARALRSPMTIAIQNAGWEGGVHLSQSIVFLLPPAQFGSVLSVPILPCFSHSQRLHLDHMPQRNQQFNIHRQQGSTFPLSRWQGAAALQARQ